MSLEGSLVGGALVTVSTVFAMAVGIPAAAPAPEYDIRVESPRTLVPGASGEVSVTLSPSANRRLSDQGPLRIAVALAPGEGLVLSKRLFRRRDAVDPKAEALRFNLKVTAEEVGTYEIELDIQFWICGKRTCRPVRERRPLTITVSAAAGPPASDAPSKAPDGGP